MVGREKKEDCEREQREDRDRKKRDKRELKRGMSNKYYYLFPAEQL